MDIRGFPLRKWMTSILHSTNRNREATSLGRRIALALLAAAGLCVVLLSDLNYAGFDAAGTSVMAQNLLRHGSLSPDGHAAGFFMNSDGTYNFRLRRFKGRLEYFFPPGPVLLAVPPTAIANAFGLDAASGTVDREIQRWLILPTILIILYVLFDLAQGFFPPLAAAAMSIGMVFGSLVGPTVGGAFWSLDGEIACMALAIRMLWQPAHRHPAYGLAFGGLMFLGFLCRPTFAPAIICLFAYMAIRERPMLLWAAPCASVLLLLFVALCRYHYGSLLPPYFFVSRLSLSRLPGAVYGLILSPSRSIFIFSPVLLMPLLFASRLRSCRNPPLVGALLVVMAACFVGNATFSNWWGGWSYGPRILANMTFVGCVTTIALIGPLQGPMRAAGVGCLAVLLALGLLVDVPGLFDRNTERWNETPGVDDNAQIVIFDWRFPQFLSLTSARVHEKCVAQMPRLPPQRRTVCPD